MEVPTPEKRTNRRMEDLQQSGKKPVNYRKMLGKCYMIRGIIAWASSGSKGTFSLEICSVEEAAIRKAQVVGHVITLASSS